MEGNKEGWNETRTLIYRREGMRQGNKEGGKVTNNKQQGEEISRGSNEMRTQEWKVGNKEIRR